MIMIFSIFYDSVFGQKLISVIVSINVGFILHQKLGHFQVTLYTSQS